MVREIVSALSDAGVAVLPQDCYYRSLNADERSVLLSVATRRALIRADS